MVLFYRSSGANCAILGPGHCVGIACLGIWQGSDSQFGGLVSCTSAEENGSAFAPDAEGKAPYILLPQRLESGKYLRDAIWDQYQNGLGAPPQQLEEKRDRLLKLGGLALEYGRQDESVWILNGCKFLEQQLQELEIPVDLRVYDGDHSSKVPLRFVSDVLPYFAKNLAKQER